MRRCICCIGLGYGDESKGRVTDYLTREYHPDFIVRYNGGSQCGHHVVLPDGRYHCFSQFGSGMLALHNIQTFFTADTMIDPLSMLVEANKLRDDFSIQYPMRNVWVNRNALVITPFHRAQSQISAIVTGHGSCGMGISAARTYELDCGADAPRAEDLLNKHVLADKLRLYQRRLQDSIFSESIDLESIDTRLRAESALLLCLRENPAHMAEQIYAAAIPLQTHIVGEELPLGCDCAIFEGAQGVLLDEVYGFHPHTTWSAIRIQPVLRLIADHFPNADVATLGVVRAFMTRHGNGPLVTETSLTSEQKLLVATEHNRPNVWQSNFRYGFPDVLAFRYAVDVAGPVKNLAVTWCDADVLNRQICLRYELPDGSKISHIPLSMYPSREHQRRLTEMLLTAKPVYSPLNYTEGSPHAIYYYTEATGLKLNIACNGATHLSTNQVEALKFERATTLRELPGPAVVG